jgi:hypothetical protein
MITAVPALLSPRAALALGAASLVLELSLITPWVDDLADKNATFHFTQHGLIFAGGLLMGVALRDVIVRARHADR